MLDSYVVDNCVWIAFFEGKLNLGKVAGSKPLKTPVLVLGEFMRVALRKGWPEQKIEMAISEIKKHSIILELDEMHIIFGAKLASNEGLSLIDAIHYSYADSNNVLLTIDSDFKELKNVKYMPGVQ